MGPAEIGKAEVKEHWENISETRGYTKVFPREFEPQGPELGIFTRIEANQASISSPSMRRKGSAAPHSSWSPTVKALRY